MKIIEKLASPNSYFIFLNIELALSIKTSKSNACLLLSGHEYEKAIINLEKLHSFKFICFDEI